MRLPQVVPAHDVCWLSLRLFTFEVRRTRDGISVCIFAVWYGCTALCVDMSCYRGALLNMCHVCDEVLWARSGARSGYGLLRVMACCEFGVTKVVCKSSLLGVSAASFSEYRLRLGAYTSPFYRNWCFFRRDSLRSGTVFNFFPSSVRYGTPSLYLTPPRPSVSRPVSICRGCFTAITHYL